MDKIDLFKAHKVDYIAAKKPVLIHIENASYLAIQGSGGPTENTFSEAVEALYAMAYTVKMSRKKLGLGDYVICKLEARYWSDSDKCLAEIPQSLWHWQLLIRTPDIVTDEDLERASATLLSKGKTEKVSAVKLINYEFGPCVQMLHIGAYSDEGRTLEQMVNFAQSEQRQPSGLHAEVYISDLRRVPAERLKTILRMPLLKPSGAG